MANTTISPNMSLPVPTVGVDPGPDWATNNDACLNAIDSHNHSAGQGVQINPSGLNINADLPVNTNNVTLTRTVRFSSQVAPLGAAADIGCLYEVGADLYYNDGSGNQVRITQGGSVSGSAGTITGLPSGTASASFAASTFTFQSATSTPANISVGPVTIGTNTASPKTVTVAPNGSQAANYNLTLPLALPGSTSLVSLDASGNLGSTVSPTLSGATFAGGTISGTISGSPTFADNPVFSGTPQLTGHLHGASGGGFSGVFTGSPELTDNPLFSGTPVFSGTPNFTGAMINGGGGTAASQAFKTALYSGTVGGSSNVTMTVPSGTIIGAFGYFANATAGVNGVIGDNSIGTSVRFFPGASSSQVTIVNDSGSSSAYRVVMFYQ